MGTTPSGIWYPESSDSTRIWELMRQQAESIRPIVPVASTTQRAAVAAELAPTPSRPLYVHRADATRNRELESTEDGETWDVIESCTPWDDWTPGYINTSGASTLEARWRRRGNLIDATLLMLLNSVSGGAFTISASSLPAPPHLVAPFANILRAIGTAALIDISAGVATGAYGGTVVQNQSTGQLHVAGHDGAWRNVSPITWGTGDRISMEFTYRAQD